MGEAAYYELFGVHALTISTRGRVCGLPVLLPMIWKSMPDLQSSFDKFARGLKQRAEEVS
jgi:hypothetical protein